MPTTFGYGLIEGPTIWVGMGQLIRDTPPLVAFPRKVFMAFDGEEVSHGAAEKQVRGFLGTVVANFKAWVNLMPDAMKFLFGDWKPQPEANDASN